MAKDNRWNSLRDQEREIETEAAYAGGGESSGGGDEQYMYPGLDKIDDESVAERTASEAEDAGGESGPGVGGGNTESAEY